MSSHDASLIPRDIRPEQLIQLVEIYSGSRNHTKDTQWKVNIGLWTLLAAAIYAGLFAKNPGFLAGLPTGAMWVFPCLHLLWAIRISLSLEADLTAIQIWRAHLLGSDSVREGSPRVFLRCAQWAVIQVGVTTTLTWGAIHVFAQAAGQRAA